MDLSRLSFSFRGLLTLTALAWLCGCKVERTPAPPRSSPPEVTAMPPSAPVPTPSQAFAPEPPAPPVLSGPALYPAAPASHPVALHQSVPFAKGTLRLNGAVTATTSEGGFTGMASPATYWPDGSVQWLRVEGIATGGVNRLSPLPLQIGSLPPAASRQRVTRLEVGMNGALQWVHSESGQRYTLTPSASLLRIRQPKPEPSSDPDFLDREGQYAWAMPQEAVTTQDQPLALKLRVVKKQIEEENALYTVICVQGNGGDAFPGKGLEWQLRAKVYHDLPLIRTEMTWIALWDVKQYALASAKWTLSSATPWSGFTSLDGGGSAPRLLLQSDARGSGMVADRTVDFPAVERDGLVASSASGLHLAIGIPNLSRLGPNHLYGEGRELEIASWSDRSGRVLDLRRSTDRSDYGTSDVDLSWNGTGVSRTLYTSFALASSRDEARALARHEAARDYLWFPSAHDLGRTRALGPYSASMIPENLEMLRGMQANLHFLRVSRDYWRWNGWANFGDIRTNHALGNVPARGLHAGRWALNGRYGWRNTSGTISHGFVQTGMLLNDRALILAGLDNAEHIIDVDAFHGSLFSKDQGDQGGMRRRNRDHWSGNVQAQYSPNGGLYLTQWLTGNRRMRDTLAGLRGYASRKNPVNSVFPAQAWLLHYQETHDPAALAEANRLLDSCAQWWKAHSKTSLEGLAALYAGNFRRVSDGIHTLTFFHEATGDPRYLQAIEASARAHPFSSDDGVPSFSHLFELAYLRAYGVTDLPDYETGRQELMKGTPEGLPSPLPIDYDSLRNIITTQLPPVGSPIYRESASIAGRATYLPVILEQFGKQANP